MQTPGVLNMDCYQGANFDYTLTWKSAGVAVNLTGYTARMQVRESYDAGSAIMSLTSGTGIALGGTAGTITITAAATATAALDGTPNKQHIYDLELVSGAGVVTRLVEGNFTIHPEVTR